MAFNLGDIIVTIKAKTDDLKKGIDEVQNLTNKAEGGVGKLGALAGGVEKFAKVAAVGMLAAGAAAAAGYYFYGTAKAKKHRHAASVWAKGLKKDVVKGMKNLKKVDAKTVAALVEDAAATYRGMRGVADTDVHAAAMELKKNWNKLQAELKPSPAVKKAVKAATKKGAVKKAVKKAVKTAKKNVKKAVASAKKSAKKATKKR